MSLKLAELAEFIEEAQPPETAAEAVDTTTGAKSVGEALLPESANYSATAGYNNRKSLLVTVKLGLLRLQSSGPQNNPNSQSSLVSFMMELGLLGSEKLARPVPQSQQTQSLLMKRGLQGS